MKRIYTDEQIVDLVREAEKTEATISEFCRQRDLTKARFISGKNASGQCRFRKSKDCANSNRRMPDPNECWLTA